MIIRLLTLSWLLVLLNGCGFEGGIVDNGNKPIDPEEEGKEAGDNRGSPDEVKVPDAGGAGPDAYEVRTILAGRFKINLPGSAEAPGRSLDEPGKSPDAEGYLYRNSTSYIEFKLVEEACEGTADGTTKGGFAKTICSDAIIQLSKGETILQLTHGRISAAALDDIVESIEVVEIPEIVE